MLYSVLKYTIFVLNSSHMPNKTDSIPIHDEFLDRRVRMLSCQKEMCLAMYNRGAGIRAMARMYGVDKRTIQFLLFPERKKRNLELRKERGGTKIYYDRAKHRSSMKDHRNYKNDLFKSN